MSVFSTNGKKKTHWYGRHSEEGPVLIESAAVFLERKISMKRQGLLVVKSLLSYSLKSEEEENVQKIRLSSKIDKGLQTHG